MDSRPRHSFNTPTFRWLDRFLLLSIACLLLFGLGHVPLSEDEGQTAVVARTIIQHGVPYGFDGQSLIASPNVPETNQDQLWILQPWLPFYTEALSFELFGESTGSARLPFAFMGLLTVFLVRGLAFRVLRNEASVLATTALLGLFVPFLLHARVARYYPMSMAMVAGLWWVHLYLPRRQWRWEALLFLLGALLFHTHPYPFVTGFSVGGLMLLGFVVQGRYPWWRGLLAYGLVAVQGLVWLQIMSLPDNMVIDVGSDGINHVWELLADLNDYLFPLVLFPLLFYFLRRRDPARLMVVSLVGGIVVSWAFVGFTTWGSIRYLVGLFPATALLGGFLFREVYRQRPKLALAGLLVLLFTNLFNMLPYLPLYPLKQIGIRKATNLLEWSGPASTPQVDFPKMLVEIFGPEWPRYTTGVADFLNTHAAPGERVLKHGTINALVFYTNQPFFRITPARRYRVPWVATPPHVYKYEEGILEQMDFSWYLPAPTAYAELPANLIEDIETFDCGHELVGPLPVELGKFPEDWDVDRYLLPVPPVDRTGAYSRTHQFGPQEDGCAPVYHVRRPG